MTFTYDNPNNLLILFCLCSLNNRSVVFSPSSVHCARHHQVRLLPFLYPFYILSVHRTIYLCFISWDIFVHSFNATCYECYKLRCNMSKQYICVLSAGTSLCILLMLLVMNAINYSVTCQLFKPEKIYTKLGVDLFGKEKLQTITSKWSARETRLLVINSHNSSRLPQTFPTKIHI